MIGGGLLYGRVVLVTRPEERSAKLKHKLEALGARVEARPTIALQPPNDMEPARRALTILDSYDWVLFTSPGGVRFFSLLGQRFLGGKPRVAGAVAVIGPTTARAAVAAGLQPRIAADASHAEGLAEALGGRVRRGQRVLIVRPEVAREVLPQALRSVGASVDAVAFYRNVAAADVGAIAHEVRRELFDVVVFTSPSTLRRLLEGAEASGVEVLGALGRARLVAIGEVTARDIERVGLRASAVADDPSDDGIVDAIRTLFAG